jgi:hypothetical protein
MNVSAIGAAQNVYPAGATGSRSTTDFKSLAQALQSGDVGAAQQAFSSLQQSAHAAHHGHHHHRQAPSTDSTTAAPTTPATCIDTVA